MSESVIQESGAVIRIVSTAGRDAVRVAPGSSDGPGGQIDATSYRIVAESLLGEPISELRLADALDVFAGDPFGVDRFEAMVRRAEQAVAASDGSDSRELVPLERARTFGQVHVAFQRALRRIGSFADAAFDRFATSVAVSAAADTYDGLCRSASSEVASIADLPEAGLYLTGTEHARLMLFGDGSSTALPAAIRVDGGIFADVLAADRVVSIAGDDPIDAVPDGELGMRTMVAVSLRDHLRRPLGILVAGDVHRRSIDVRTLECVRRYGLVLAGMLTASGEARRNIVALATLPDLAAVAHDAESSPVERLDRLARIAVESTGSDAAVIRLRDTSGSQLETRAIYSVRADRASDVVGTTTRLDGTVPSEESGGRECELFQEPDMEATWETWSAPGRRMLDALAARTVASIPIGSSFGRAGVMYLVRTTARPLDVADWACARIVTSHAQHIVDGTMAALQASRAVDSAQSAIRLLGEALIAGLRTDRTMRFLPRLYVEMFECSGCRVWQRDVTTGSQELSYIGGAGTFESQEPAACVFDALSEALRLFTVHDADAGRTDMAVGIEPIPGVRVVIELHLSDYRALGSGEQRFAVDVASRVAEAISAAAAAATDHRQLQQVRSLLNAIARAYHRLSESHVVATIAEDIPDLFEARSSAVFIVGDDGRLEARVVRDVPSEVIEAMEAARHWAPDASGDERSDVIAIEHLGSDHRLARLSGVFHRTGVDAWSGFLVPFSARDQTVGCLMLLFEDGIPASLSGESRMITAFGRHIGIALLNARDFEREHVARQRVQRVLEVERENSRQVRALHEVSRTFATSLSLDETMRAVVEAMADRLDVDAVWLRTPNERGDQLIVRAFHASQPELAEALERMVSGPDARSGPITSRVVQTRQPVLIAGDDINDPAFAAAETLQRLRPFLNRGSTIAVLPIATPIEVLGTVTMLSIDPGHALTNDKVDIAAGVATQAALALDNARLYSQQKHFADVIQESLLPSHLPQVPGIDLGVLYRSATGGGAEVGGDFYDFLELEGGQLAIAVGDVCGKGVAAAADTAMTKYIFRALAREHPTPDDFLRTANEVVCEEITSGKFVTLFYAVIDRAAGTVTCGKAGHPEPKLMRVGETGEVEMTSIEIEGLALGIMPDQRYEVVTLPFTEGSSLVIYTDGVVEARRGPKLYGQYRLERRLRDEATGSPPQIAFAIYEDCAAYAEGDLGDDVAIVVAQGVGVALEDDASRQVGR